MTKAKKSKAKSASIVATLELVTDPGFSWSFAPSDIEFCGEDELIASFHSIDTMYVRRWRVSDGAVTFDASFALPQAALDRRSVHLQWIADRADRTRGELLWLDRAGQPALLDPRTLDVARALPESNADHTMVFAADGAIVYVEEGSLVRVFDLETLRERARHSFEFGEAMVSVSTGGEHLVIVETNGSSRALSLADGSVVKLPSDGRQPGVTLLDRSRVLLFTSANAGRVACVRSLDDGPSTDLSCAAIVTRTAAARDESAWVAYGMGKAIFCFDAATRSLRWSVTLDGAADSAVFSADGRWLAAATQHRLTLIDVRTGALHPSHGPADTAGTLEVGDGFVLARPSITTRNATHLWTWDPSDPSAKARSTMLPASAATIVGDKIARVDGAQYSLSTVAELLAEERVTPEKAALVTRAFESFAIDAKGALYRPTSEFVARKYAHGVERCERAHDGTWKRVSLGIPQKKPAVALCVLEAQRQLVVGWDSRELTFVDLETGEQLRTISKLKKPAQRIIATRDGSTLALALGGYLLAFVHGSTVTATPRPTSGYAWTPDERWLLSVNYERVDRFDARTGELRATATISPSARSIAVADDGTLYVGALDTNVYRLRLPESFWSD